MKGIKWFSMDTDSI